MALSAAVIAGVYSSIAQTQTTASDVAIKARLQGIVKEILSIWERFDVVCLGEDHGRRNDSDLRIALVEHPDFIRKVDVIIVEFADTLHQDILDRLALEGEDIPREKLRAIWKDTSGSEVWELPIYEEFLRAVRSVNLTVARSERVRLIGGDNSKERNRGKFIREAVSREILDKGLKGLAVYGSGHCECRGMGFPGELEEKYPGKIWSAFTFYDVEEGRRVLSLGDDPKLIQITGTEKAKIPASKMFFNGRYNDRARLGEIVNAIIYYGNAK